MAELLVVLLTVLAALVVHGLLARPLELAGYAFAQPELGQWRLGAEPAVRQPLIEAEPVPLTRQVQAAMPLDVGEAVPLAAAEQTRSERILMLGDSMIEPLQQRAAEYFRGSGHHFISVIWYGSRTLDWGGTARLAETLSTYAPTYVMVVLGSNELSARHIERRARFVRRMKEVLRERPFVWIGPPNWRKDTGLNALLQQELGTNFFSSENLELARKSDGIHPTDRAGVTWMDRVAAWLQTHQSARLALAEPESRKGRHAPARVWPPPSR